MDRIKFSNKIITDHVRTKSQQRRCYELFQWKTRGEFYIINNISDYITLVQLIKTTGNVNHAVSINVYWIYYSD